ncbi:MAG: hypothetical protein QMC83_03085 [Thermodesulfovibrionales bacterium]|nr:hypothetical protein [Thermodesulfovibrionales bacterium]
MKVRIKKYEDASPIDFLLLREELGFKRYRKQVERNAEEKEILMDLAIKKIKEKEKDDFILIGYKRRRLKIPFSL